MTSSKAQNIGKIIIFGVLLLLMLTVFSAMMTPVKWFDDFLIQNRNARITELMKQETDTIDVMNVGDSLSLSALSPMEMWRQKGYTSFNIGSDGIRMPEAYYTVKTACKEQSPRYLLIETLTLFRYSENQDMQMLLSQPLYYRFTFLKYHSIWKPFVEGRGVKIYHKGYLINRRISEYDGDADYLDESLGSDQKLYIPEHNRRWFRKLKNYCDQRGIKIILYSMPSPRNYNWERVNNLAAFAGEEGVEYFDLNQMLQEVGIDWKTDSSDGGDHLNLNGVRKVTSFFGDYLSGQGDLTDHRGDPAYASWDEELVAYDQLVEEMEGMYFGDVQKKRDQERKEEKEKKRQKNNSN